MNSFSDFTLLKSITFGLCYSQINFSRFYSIPHHDYYLSLYTFFCLLQDWFTFWWVLISFQVDCWKSQQNLSLFYSSWQNLSRFYYSQSNSFFSGCTESFHLNPFWVLLSSWSNPFLGSTVFLIDTFLWVELIFLVWPSWSTRPIHLQGFLPFMGHLSI